MPDEEQQIAPSVQSQPEVPAEPPAVMADPEVKVPTEPLTWQASEYVHHHKGPVWYVGLMLVIGVLLAISVIFKLWLSVAVFLVMGVAIAVYAQRPPRALEYRLDEHGITIDGKLFPYDNFRSFGVISDLSWHSIDLEPTQRFMPRLTIIYGENLDELTDYFSVYLPRADR